MIRSGFARPQTVMPQWCCLTVLDEEGNVLSVHVVVGPLRPGLAEVDRVARLALFARRCGGNVILSDVRPELRVLLGLAGLLAVQVERQPEEGEQPLRIERAEEERHLGDPST